MKPEDFGQPAKKLTEGEIDAMAAQAAIRKLRDDLDDAVRRLFLLYLVLEEKGLVTLHEMETVVERAEAKLIPAPKKRRGRPPKKKK